MWCTLHGALTDSVVRSISTHKLFHHRIDEFSMLLKMWLRYVAKPLPWFIRIIYMLLLLLLMLMIQQYLSRAHCQGKILYNTQRPYRTIPYNTLFKPFSVIITAISHQHYTYFHKTMIEWFTACILGLCVCVCMLLHVHALFVDCLIILQTTWPNYLF